jgi:hypothetical protein
VAHYRDGNSAAAIEALTRSIELHKGSDATDFFFMAMAHWQRSEQAKARAWYDQAVSWMDKHNPRDEELKRFRAEATELLGLVKSEDSQKRQN